MFRMIALDMDGTLLDHQQRISKENARAIEKAREKGIKVVLSTGRALPGIDDYLEQLNLKEEDEYSVTCSGAYVVNNINTKTVEEKYLSYEELHGILQIFDPYQIHYNFYTQDKIYTKSNNFTTHIDAFANKLPMEIVDFNHLNKDIKIIKITLINEDLSVKDEITSIYPDIPLKNPDIFSRTNDKFNKELFKDITRLSQDLLEKYTLLKTTPYHIEILNKSSHKGNGVKRLAELYGIKKEEIICIGDSGNDRQMIEYAGLGVAMGNAVEDIKQIADYVTLSNQEHGVAHVIEKFVL